jgi:hypothetical protein
MRTQEIILPSGIACEVRQMLGKELNDLSNTENIRTDKALSKVLRKCLVKLGDETEITEQTISQLTEPDYKAILLYARMLSYRMRPNFKVVVKWNGADNQEFSHTHEIAVLDKNFNIKYATNLTTVKKYEDVLAERQITLPDSGIIVHFRVASAENKAKINDLGDNIKRRYPRFKDTNGFKALDLDELSADDYQFLYENIVLAEGSIDTTAIVTNPYNDRDTKTIDLLGCQGFFFPFLVV